MGLITLIWLLPGSLLASAALLMCVIVLSAEYKTSTPEDMKMPY